MQSIPLHGFDFSRNPFDLEKDKRSKFSIPHKPPPLPNFLFFKQTHLQKSDLVIRGESIFSNLGGGVKSISKDSNSSEIIPSTTTQGGIQFTADSTLSSAVDSISPLYVVLNHLACIVEGRPSLTIRPSSHHATIVDLLRLLFTVVMDRGKA